MRLLIIPSWYPSKGNPVNGIFFREQALALSKSGHHVTVIDVTFHGRNDFFRKDNFRFFYKNDEGIHTYSYKMPSFYIFSRISFVFILLYKFLLFRVFKKIIKKGINFDVIHAHSFFPAGFCACDISKKYNIPLVVTEHNTDVLEKRLSKYYQNRLQKTIENCHKFLCVSEALRLSVLEQVKMEHKLLVVPNMFSSDFIYLDRGKNISNNFTFLSIGFFNERKRHDYAISCFEEAFRDIPNVRFEIIGKGELYDMCQKQILENDLQGKVQLFDLLPRKELVKKMQECDIFVLASTFENFGVVYVEAMACGKPVIATKNGGAESIVNETNGILIEKDNKEQLVEAFRYMYHNVHKYDSKKIAEDCYAKYSEEAVVKQLSTVYFEITAK